MLTKILLLIILLLNISTLGFLYKKFPETITGGDGDGSSIVPDASEVANDAPEELATADNAQGNEGEESGKASLRGSMLRK